MKDYIKEFGDDQKGKNIPIKFEPQDEWGFEPDITNKPTQSTQEPPENDNQKSFATENQPAPQSKYTSRKAVYIDPKTRKPREIDYFSEPITPTNTNQKNIATENQPISAPASNFKPKYASRKAVYVDPKTRKPREIDYFSEPKLSTNENKVIYKSELKNMVSETVLKFMNKPELTPSSSELLQEHRNELESRIKQICTRVGIMAISLREDTEKDEAIVGALIDPTNRKNWIQMKEEIVYKLPYSYKESLHAFAKQVWDKNKLV